VLGDAVACASGGTVGTFVARRIGGDELHLDLRRVDDVGTQLDPSTRTRIARELLVELGALPS
jgi:hypothetical protein